MSQELYCPKCKIVLSHKDGSLYCGTCARSYPDIDGIPCFIDRDLPVDSFDGELFEYIYETEQKHFWHIGRKEIIFDLICRLPTNIRDIRMLEVGCGNGSVLSYLKQHGINIEGADIFIEGLKFCRQRIGPGGLYQADIMALPFVQNYDMVGAFDVLEHLVDDDKALREINTALKPGGLLLITVPANKFVWSYWDEVSHHKRRYSEKEIKAKVEQSGFKIRRISHYMFFSFPLLVLVRLFNKYTTMKKTDYNIKDSNELKTVPIVNDILLLLLRLEKRMLRHMNFPFGASLLVLAEKQNSKSSL